MKPAFEQDMLDAQFQPEPNELKDLEAQLGEIGDDIWDGSQLEDVLRSWVHSVSSKGVFESSLEPPKLASSDPRVHLAPAVLLRKRTERSFLRAFNEILEQLKGGAPVPPGVGRFVTVTEDPGGELREREGAPTAGRPQEIYFPLESNDAQRRIVERLTSHQGVLVQGPPGTGKSHTIVNLICHLLAEGKRVLVTSHTPRALRVLRHLIHERVPAIEPLVVVLLGDDRESLDAMENSVQGITGRHSNWEPERNKRKIAAKEKELDSLRREEASILQDLRSIREKETYDHSPRFGNYEGKLARIAGRISREAASYAWFKDCPPENKESPLSDQDLAELVRLRRDKNVLEAPAWNWEALAPKAFLTPEEFARLVEKEKEAQRKYNEVEVERARSHRAYPCLTQIPAEDRRRLAGEIERLIAEAGRIARHFHDWTAAAVHQILGDHDRAWRELYATTTEHLKAIESRARWADETPVSGLADRDHSKVRADAQDVLAHLVSGGGWGFWGFRPAPVKQAIYLLRNAKIGGRACKNIKMLRNLTSWLDVEQRLKTLRGLWRPYSKVVERGFAAQAADFRDLIEPLGNALALHRKVGQLRTLLSSFPRVPEPTWHDLDALRAFLDAVRAVDLEIAVSQTREALKEKATSLERRIRSAKADPQTQALLKALKARDLASYGRVHEQIRAHFEIAKKLEWLSVLDETLRDGAPKLATTLASTAGDPAWDQRARSFHAAWNWARAKAWIQRLCDPKADQELRQRLDDVRDRIRKRLQEISAKKAWMHCFDRMTEHERQHLVAWSKAMRNIGKGTGKYAPRHRRAARKHMEECRSAIPAWVMPLYRVAETIRPQKDLFDVIIVDEASQSGPEALLLTYLAKKLVVVGDDKQIAPEFIGVGREDVNQRRARHIAALPHSDQYGVDNSFFDLAEIRYGGRIRLREHFRCMPEIIQFSEHALLPSRTARTTQAVWRLST